MANKNSRRAVAEARKADKHFHGTACNTSFANKSDANKRRSAWRGCPAVKRDNS